MSRVPFPPHPPLVSTFDKDDASRQSVIRASWTAVADEARGGPAWLKRMADLVALARARDIEAIAAQADNSKSWYAKQMVLQAEGTLRPARAELFSLLRAYIAQVEDYVIAHNLPPFSQGDTHDSTRHREYMIALLMERGLAEKRAIEEVVKFEKKPPTARKVYSFVKPDPETER